MKTCPQPYQPEPTRIDIASRDGPRALDAELLDDGGRREARHESRRHKDGKDDNFRAIQGDVAGGADDGREKREHAFKRKLQKFNQASYGDADAKGDELRAKAHTPVTEERVTERDIHAGLTVAVRKAKRKS